MDPGFRRDDDLAAFTRMTASRVRRDEELAAFAG